MSKYPEIITIIFVSSIIAVQCSDDTAMKTCQLSHSFETCHHAVYR